MSTNLDLKYNLETKFFSVSCYCPSDLKAYRNTDQIKEYRIFILNGENEKVMIDFDTFQINAPTLFFLTPKQEFSLYGNNKSGLKVIAFSQDFYCIDKHDKEVSCYGFLFANAFHSTKLELEGGSLEMIENIVEQMRSELVSVKAVQEDMLKLLLKQLLIISVRFKRKQEEISEAVYDGNFSLIRAFNRLLDQQYKRNHNVSFYAEQLNYTPKSFSNKIKKLTQKTPLEMIKNKLVLESKRMMVYDNVSVKEIAFALGFEDTAYFSRFFKKNVGISPGQFKNSFVKS